MLVAAALSSIALPVLGEASGRDIYVDTCIACHGPDGQGALPGVPDLVALDWRAGGDDATLLRRVREGFRRPGSPLAMPPKGGNPALTDADLRAVLDYMKNMLAR
ncbi:MAG TPA: cytochrome c [Candidatus Polarisedimenticolaceae bacterium]|nr:cytochrome c [Candidatus Polarisedimenticolaceae bacterium]